MQCTIRFRLVTAYAMTLGISLCTGAYAQETPVFGSVADLGQSGAGERLQGAFALKSSDWLASFYATIPAGADALGRPLVLHCTSTLIGSRALITAAHCVPDGGRVSIRVEGEIFGGSCTRSSKYTNDDSADYAFCLLDADVVTPSLVYESINLDPQRLKLQERLLLTGFGCLDIVNDKAVGGNDGVYRGGFVQITALPGNAGNERNTILTKGADDPNTALCMGDSGGAAFLIDPVTNKRLFVSVNSRVRDTTKQSLLSSTSSADAKEFFVAQFRAHDLKVCGESPEAKRCR